MDPKKENPFRSPESSSVGEAKFLRVLRGISDLRSYSPEIFEKYISQLKERIDGGHPRLISTEKFPGWSIKDFQRLLDILEGREMYSRTITEPAKTLEPKAEGIGPEEIRNKADYLRKRKEMDPRNFRIAIQEIQEMAGGENPQNIRQYYKGWKDADFTKLLKELEADID